MQVNDDPSYLAGHFKSVREALDKVIPAEVAPVGVTFIQGLVTTTEADFDMGIIKGICAGALAVCSASQVATFNTDDDIPADILNRDWEEHAGEQVGIDALSLYDELGNAVAACYQGYIAPSDKMTIDLSTENYNFVVHVKRWVWPSADCDNLIEIHLEAEGGPPSLLFFTRRENNDRQEN